MPQASPTPNAIGSLRLDTNMRAVCSKTVESRPTHKPTKAPAPANPYGLALFDLIEPALPGVFTLPRPPGTPEGPTGRPLAGGTP